MQFRTYTYYLSTYVSEKQSLIFYINIFYFFFFSFLPRVLKKRSKPPYRKILLSVPVAACIASASCHMWTTTIILTYLPKYFNKLLQFSVQEVVFLCILLSSLATSIIVITVLEPVCGWNCKIAYILMWWVEQIFVNCNNKSHSIFLFKTYF